MTTRDPAPLRLGLVVPGDSHIDDEFWALTDGLALPFVTRTIGADDVEMGGESISEVTGIAEGPEIAQAAQRLRYVDPVAAAYVDTSISFVRGRGGDTEIAERISGILGCPAIVTSTAIVAAFQALGVRRVLALSPYTDDLNERMRSYFASHGITLSAVRPYRRTYPGGTTSGELGLVHPDELLEDVRTALEGGEPRAGGGPRAGGEPRAGGDVEGILLACTAVRTAAAVMPIEAATGLPVVTAVGATMWAVLRLAGAREPRPAHGRLFALDALPADFEPSALPEPFRRSAGTAGG